MTVLFSETFVKRKLKNKGKRYVLTDSRTTGFAIVVNKSGSAFYYYRYRDKQTDKIVEIQVGAVNGINLDDARDAVKVLAGKVAKGIDVKGVQVESKKKSANSNDLKLFRYIDKYYKLYVKKKNVDPEKLIRLLKNEFQDLRNKDIRKINKNDIDKWRDKRGASKKKIKFATMVRYYGQLKACVNTARDHFNLIDKFELDRYTLKRRITETASEKKVRYLLKDEEIRLITAMEKRDKSLREKRDKMIKWQSIRNSSKRHVESISDNDYPDHVTPMIIIGYHTGLDIGDIFVLDWKKNIDFHNKLIRKVRNKTSHSENEPEAMNIPMSPTVYTVLRQWAIQHGEKGLVFKNHKTGKPFTTIKKSWSTVKKMAQLKDFRFKDLRHTFASWHAMEGTSLWKISKYLGHKSIETTQIYAHLCIDQDEKSFSQIFG